MTQRSRELRKNATEEERLLWHALRGGNLKHKVRRQQPLGHRIVDFFCHEARLAIEIDGDTHNALHDELRDAELAIGGVKVIRFTNTEVRDNVFDVIAKIKQELDLRARERTAAPSPHPVQLRNE